MIQVRVIKGETFQAAFARIQKAIHAELGRKGGSRSTPAKRRAALDREARKRQERNQA